jgi:thiol-disulfide isomerase/thioredoxin
MSATLPRHSSSRNIALGRRGAFSGFAAAFALAFSACSAPQEHGSMSSLSIASQSDWQACEHGVPAEVCVRCEPERATAYKARGDWCPEHDVPESQCLSCHPDLDFSPPEPPPSRADVKALVTEGEDLASLEPHLAAGKFTIFDFHADWCPPCRKVDEYLFAEMKKRGDIAIRKLNVVSWDSPIAERWLRDVPELPLLIVFDPAGKRLGQVHGARFSELARLLERKP